MFWGSVFHRWLPLVPSLKSAVKQCQRHWWAHGPLRCIRDMIMCIRCWFWYRDWSRRDVTRNMTMWLSTMWLWWRNLKRDEDTCGRDHYQCRKCSQPNSVSWVCSRCHQFGGHNRHEILETTERTKTMDFYRRPFICYTPVLVTQEMGTHFMYFFGTFILLCTRINIYIL